MICIIFPQGKPNTFLIFYFFFLIEKCSSPELVSLFLSDSFYLYQKKKPFPANYRHWKEDWAGIWEQNKQEN